MLGYVWRDLVRNPRRTAASLAGIALGVGLFSAVLFFDQGSAATLTKRAIAPLVLDMQRVLTAPLGRQLVLEERLDAPPSLRPGEEVEFTLTVENRGSSPANEVVVNDEPPPPLSYLHGTTTLDGHPVADVVGQSPLAQGLARTGLNIGTVQPGDAITITYRARADAAVDDTMTLASQATISSRESVVPESANAPPPATLAQLVAEIGLIPGVSAADGLSFVDLPRGSLRSGTSTIDRPVRVFGFAPAYQEHHPSIRLSAGSLTRDEVALSAEAARTLGATLGSVVSLSLPGRFEPETLAVGGVADLGRATPLFSSRKARKLEDFLYVPDSIILSPETFDRLVIPAFRTAAATQGTVLRNVPVLEVDVVVDRSTLRSDPGRALAQTTAIARAIDAVAPGQDYLIDNISNALQVARADAAVGRRMFVFIGIPGVVLAGFLAAYTGRIVASTQRREHANLRLRGAQPGHLRRMLAARTALLAGLGSLAGLMIGGLGALAVLGSSSMTAAPGTDLALTAVLALGIGTLGTGLALWVPARRWLRTEIGLERRELPLDEPPAWRRWRLDLILLGIATVAEVAAFRLGAFDAPPTAVSVGESPSLPSFLLVAPLLAWFGGTLVVVRVFHRIVSLLRVRAAPGFGPVGRGILVRSLRRRPWALGTGIVGVCLVTAFGINLVVFAATYADAKAADARFVVGGDLRITPSSLGSHPLAAGEAGRLEVDGVERASPVVYELENSVLIGPYDQDRADLAAIDPSTFATVAPLSDSFFVDGSAADAMAALAADPHALLVEADTAEGLSIATGDRVEVLLERGTDVQTLEEFTVVGEFVRFPGFPQGLGLVANRALLEEVTGVTRADFFVARTSGTKEDDLARAIAAVESVTSAEDPVDVVSSATALDKDQSSLTAFDLRGLEQLDVLFTVSMSAACVVIFVFALILQRRREYVTLRAQGVTAAELRLLVLGEAGIVATSGAIAGTAIGLGMAPLFVHVLRPLFVLDPRVTPPAATVLAIAGVPIAAAVVGSVIAAAMLERIEPTELLRES